MPDAATGLQMGMSIPGRMSALGQALQNISSMGFQMGEQQRGIQGKLQEIQATGAQERQTQAAVPAIHEEELRRRMAVGLEARNKLMAVGLGDHAEAVNKVMVKDLKNSLEQGGMGNVKIGAPTGAPGQAPGQAPQDQVQSPEDALRSQYYTDESIPAVPFLPEMGALRGTRMTPQDTLLAEHRKALENLRGQALTEIERKNREFADLRGQSLEIQKRHQNLREEYLDFRKQIAEAKTPEEIKALQARAARDLAIVGEIQGKASPMDMVKYRSLVSQHTEAKSTLDMLKSMYPDDQNKWQAEQGTVSDLEKQIGEMESATPSRTQPTATKTLDRVVYKAGQAYNLYTDGSTEPRK